MSLFGPNSELLGLINDAIAKAAAQLKTIPNLVGQAGKVLGTDGTQLVWMGAVGNSLPIAGGCSFGPPGYAKLLTFVYPGGYSLAQNFQGSIGYAGSASTGTMVFDIAKNGVSVGTMTFNPGIPTPVFSSTALVTFAQGDVLTIVAPPTQDPTLADIGFTLMATLM